MNTWYTGYELIFLQEKRITRELDCFCGWINTSWMLWCLGRVRCAEWIRSIVFSMLYLLESTSKSKFASGVGGDRVYHEHTSLFRVGWGGCGQWTWGRWRATHTQLQVSANASVIDRGNYCGRVRGRGGASWGVGGAALRHQILFASHFRFRSPDVC